MAVERAQAACNEALHTYDANCEQPKQAQLNLEGANLCPPGG